MDPVLWDAIKVAIGAMAGIIAAVGAWAVQRRKVESEAESAVDERWAKLADQYEQRIASLHTHIAEIGKIDDLLQRQVAASAIDRLDMHEQLRAMETQAIERERRLRTVEEMLISKDARIAELEREVVSLKSRIAELERENNCLRDAR
jgi:chromosome segregation ATPase